MNRSPINGSQIRESHLVCPTGTPGTEEGTQTMAGVLAEIAPDLEDANQTQALPPLQPPPTRRHLGTTAQQAAPDPQLQEGDPPTPQGGEEAPEEPAEGDP